MEITMKFDYEDMAGFFPRRYEIGDGYDAWLYPHINLLTGECDADDVVLITFDSTGRKKTSRIYIFSEHKSHFEDLEHIGKIINLIHDCCTEFDCFFEEVDDIYSDEVDEKIKALIGNQ